MSRPRSIPTLSATTLTAIFAVYAGALLVTLIPAGALSDQCSSLLSRLPRSSSP